MTCRCPKGWCYFRMGVTGVERDDCRSYRDLEAELATNAKVAGPATNEAAKSNAPPAKRRIAPRCPDTKVAAVASLDRAIDRLVQTSMPSMRRQIRLAPLIERRKELLGVD